MINTYKSLSYRDIEEREREREIERERERERERAGLPSTHAVAVSGACNDHKQNLKQNNVPFCGAKYT